MCIRDRIIGDVRHSRVARSDVDVYTKLGATVTVVAPQGLQPSDVDKWPVEVSENLDEVLPKFDVVGLLRIQTERMDDSSALPVTDYVERYGITEARATTLKDDVVITHPGPVNRGIEIADSVLDGRPNVLVSKQVMNGVALRMAVLFRLLGSGIEIE